MTKLMGFIGATLGSAIGWWLGAKIGMMTAFMVSTVCSGVGIYFGRRAGEHYSL